MKCSVTSKPPFTKQQRPCANPAQPYLEMKVVKCELEPELNGLKWAKWAKTSKRAKVKGLNGLKGSEIARILISRYEFLDNCYSQEAADMVPLSPVAGAAGSPPSNVFS